MADGPTGVGLGGAQVGDVEIGDVAGGNVIHGADPGRLVEMMELLIRNAWDDAQQRDRRQAEADFHREMTRQRMERIATDVRDLQAAVARGAEVSQLVARALVALTVAVIVGAVVVTWIVLDRAGALSMARILIGAGGALAIETLRGR